MTIECAMVGVGGWARMSLVPAIKAVPDLVLTACAGATLAEAQAFAAAHDIPHAFAGIDELLAVRRDVGLVVIATPDDHHPAATRAALTAGAAVYCEKPLANEAATAHDMADMAERLRRPGTVGFSFRYSPAIGALQRDLRAGSLGEPWLIELFEHNPQFHPRHGRPLNWKGDPAQARAGALFEYGAHIVDLAGWLIGPIRGVSTSFTRVVPGARLDDIATLQLRFTAPAIGTLVASWVLGGTFPGIRIRVHGAEGLGDVELNQTVGGGERYHRIPLTGGAGEPVALEPLGEAISGYARRHLTDFAAIAQGRPARHDAVLPTLRDGARAQDVLEAALAATAQWVDVRYLQEDERNQRGGDLDVTIEQAAS